MRAFVVQVLRRELLLALRRPSDMLGSLAFFVIVCSLFPLGLGPEPELLRRIGPGVLWVAALLALLLSLPRLYASDHADGTLEQLLLAPHGGAVLAFAKTLAHWLISGVPLLLASPLLALQYGLDGEAIALLALSLALGTPALSQLGSIAAALTLGARGAGVLLAVLVLPLYIPVLIFGTDAVLAQQSGQSAEPQLLLLAALSFAGTAAAPWLGGAALALALE